MNLTSARSGWHHNALDWQSNSGISQIRTFLFTPD